MMTQQPPNRRSAQPPGAEPEGPFLLPPRAVLLGGVFVAVVAIVLHVGLRVEFAIDDNRPGAEDRAVNARQFAFALSIHRTGGAPVSRGLALNTARGRDMSPETLRGRARASTTDAERNQALEWIHQELLSRASAYGLSTGDVIDALGEPGEGNGR